MLPGVLQNPGDTPGAPRPRAVQSVHVRGYSGRERGWDVVESEPVLQREYSVNETATIIGLSRVSVYRLVNLGELRPTRHRRVRRTTFSGREITRYLERSVRAPRE